MESTQIVAWWGAVIATLVLLWDILKWFQSGPKIKKRIALNTHYNDGEVISKEKTKNGEITSYEKYCHVEIVNTGTLSTTVMGISASHKPTKGLVQFGTMEQAFTEHFGKKLPYVIAPGDVWSCRLPMHHYHSLHKYGTPEIYVKVSHLNKPLVVRATKAANKALKSEVQ